jgi:type II secretory pathway component PulK
MNRLIVALLTVLIVLVAVHGFLVWRAGEQAQDQAEVQTCLQRSQATTIIGLVAPAIVVGQSDDKEVRDSNLQALRALGEQSDEC